MDSRGTLSQNWRQEGEHGIPSSLINPSVIIRYPGCGAPWVFPWVAPGWIPVSILRTPVAGATPLEGPGPSGASLPPEPWDGGFPPGVLRLY